MKKAILYVGNFFYPDGNAAGKRVYGNIKLIKECGYIPLILCFDKEQGEYFSRVEIDGASVYTIPYSDGVSRLDNRKPFRAFKLIIQEYSKKYFISAVIMYTTMGTFDFNRKIINYCKRENIKTVYDFCDYFDVIQKNNIFKYYIKLRDLRVLKNDVLAKCDGIIAISSFLEKFVNRKCVKIILPPLAVTKCEEIGQPGEKGFVTIAYASYISDKNRPIIEWKDRIDLFIDIFYDIKVQNGNDRFLLKFVGFTKIDFINMLPIELKQIYEKKIGELGKNIVFIGQCSNADAQIQIRNSDYTILLRDSKTSTNAGFPTKISESISLGVPVITNITSDIDFYIKDGKNGIIVPGPLSIEETKSIINSVVCQGEAKAYELKSNTIQDSPFYYSNYVGNFGRFLNKLEEINSDI